MTTGGGRRRPALRGVATGGFILLWLVAAFLLLETAARLQGYWVARHNRLAVEEMERRVGLMAAFDQTLWETPWFRYRRNATLETEWRGHACRIATNSHGFRDEEVALPKPAGLYRIACIGGSTTVEGWTNATTYPALVQERLSAALGPGTVEVLNCGISSFTTDRELQRLPDVLALQPDLVLEYGCINDITALVPRLMQDASPWQNLLARSQLLLRVLDERLLPSDAAVEARLTRRTFANLEAIAERAAAAGAEVGFLSFAATHPERLSGDERAYVDFTMRVDFEGGRIGLNGYRRWVDLYNRMLEDFCRQRGYLYIPLAEEMPGEMEWFADFCHMTESGIARKAEIVAAHLEPYVRARTARVR